MKPRYWLLPVLMLVSALPYTLICELLSPMHPLLPIAAALILYALIAFLLSRTCTRKTVLLSSAGLLLFSVVLTALHQIPSLGRGPFPLPLALAYLWEILFAPFLALPLPNLPLLFFVLPALIPFSWAFFCKPS